MSPIGPPQFHPVQACLGIIHALSLSNSVLNRAVEVHFERLLLCLELLGRKGVFLENFVVFFLLRLDFESAFCHQNVFRHFSDVSLHQSGIAEALVLHFFNSGLRLIACNPTFRGIQFLNCSLPGHCRFAIELLKIVHLLFDPVLEPFGFSPLDFGFLNHDVLEAVLHLVEVALGLLALDLSLPPHILDNGLLLLYLGVGNSQIPLETALCLVRLFYFLAAPQLAWNYARFIILFR